MEMQAPVLPHINPVTTAQLVHLIQEYGPLKLAVDQARPVGQGNWQRNAPPQVSIAERQKLAEIQHQINADIDTIDLMCTAHQQYVQDLVDRAKGYMASVKKSVELYEAIPEQGNLEQALRLTQQGAHAMDGIADNGVQAERAYGQAWFEYRANPPELPEGVSKEYFQTKRKDIMTRGKVIAAKVEKLSQLHVQAKAYRELSIKLAEGGKKKKSEVKDAALALNQKLAGLLHDGITNRDKNAWGEDGRVWKTKVDRLHTMATHPITRPIQAESASWYGEMEAALKAFRNQVKTMETVWLTATKAYTPKQMKGQQKLFDQAHANLVRAQHIYQEADAQLKLAKQHNDVVQHAHV